MIYRPLGSLIVGTLVILFAHSTPAAAQSDRSGFTFNVDLGVGIQSDTAIEQTAVGLAGLNLGLGGWATDQIAILARLTGTYAVHDLGRFGEVSQVSGVVAPTLQVWPTARGYVEAGVGMGYWNADGELDRGLGLVLGAGVSLLNRGKHNLIVGVEYVPVFTNDPVHNFGISIGYQLW